MAPLTWTRDGTVATLWMDDGENRHNPAFVAQFLAAMDAIEADPETRAVVIASKDPKNWSQGIDLAWIQAAMADRARHDEIRDFLRGLNRIYARCLTYPMPVIAAIGGHAFGDGALLACACDFRFMRSDRGFFCFPEVDLGIPFLPGMLAVVRTAFPDWKLDSMMLTGHRAGGAELAEARVVVKACDGPEALMDDALAFARTFDKGRGVFRVLKERRHRETLAVFETLDPPVIERLQLMVR
ncbi:MAG TPA: enoyl-CoA hydratase/isomerase family protein [Myxococcota bacterium]|jgi:enoyl-CoA hydratase/carnithine racemase|nr:enoyl-CoA hydratase/isomerase family protein [Myxococcota bacterium]